MKKLLASLAMLLLISPAFAADNAVIVTPGVGVTMKSKDIGSGVQAMQPILSDTAGNALSLPTVGADTASNTAPGLAVYNRPWVWNGTTWDRAPGTTLGAYGILRDASGNARGANVDASNRLTTAPSLLSGSVASGAYASGALASGSVASGAMVDLGAQADAACGTDNGSCSAIALIKRGNQNLTTVNTTAAAAVAAGTNRIGYVSDDPCTQKTKTNLPISQNGTSSVQLVALSGSTVIYVCSLSLIAAGATTVALTTGTGTACVTGNAAVIGSTTANIANSLSLAANGGLTMGSGNGSVALGAASSELCMVLGTNVFVSGNLTYVQQ